MGDAVVLPRAMYKAGIPKRVDTLEQYDRAVADGYGDFQVIPPDAIEGELEQREPSRLEEPPEPAAISSEAAAASDGTEASTSASETDAAAASDSPVIQEILDTGTLSAVSPEFKKKKK